MIPLQSLEFTWRPSAALYEQYLRWPLLSLRCYSGRLCRFVEFTQPSLGFRFSPSSACPVFTVLHALAVQECSQRACSCPVVTDFGVRCTKGGLVYPGGTAQCQFGIVKWQHQGRARACGTVIKRHLEINGDVYFMNTVDRCDAKSGHQCDTMSISFSGFVRGKTQRVTLQVRRLMPAIP